jgi:hypothetical protein
MHTNAHIKKLALVAILAVPALAFAADPAPAVGGVDTAALIDSFVAAFPVSKVAQAVASICISMIGLVAIGFAFDAVRKRMKG